mgnify:CR=1 FL=1
MPLLKSLICFKGFDNGRRFLVISFICYLFFFILSSVLIKAPILLVLLLITATPVLLASSIRRIRDAGFNIILAALAPVVFWLCVFGITYINHGASWFLLLFALIVTLAMTTISNARVRHSHQYFMGYSGPVDIKASTEKMPSHHFHHQRIEPTIASGQTKQSDQTSQTNDSKPHDESVRVNRASAQTGWEQQLGAWFSNNKQLSLFATVTIFVAVIISIVWGVFDQPQQTAEQVTEQKVVSPTKQRLNKIEMPDNFWLMLDEFDALTIGWQGDLTKDGQAWSALTAEGDNDCFEINFSIRDEYRTMLVTVKNQGDYYADFSPIDTKKIIHSIAQRDKFSLCGYDFSLKGTQAKLMNNQKYSSYFDE